MMKLIIFKIVEKITCGKIVKKIDDRKINNFHTGGFGVRCRKQRCGKGGAVCASIFAVSLFFTACTAESPMEVQTLTLKRADGSTVSVRAEIASTPAQQSRGFMKRKRIPDGTGMLFVFRFERTHPRHIRYEAVQPRAGQKYGERALCTRSAARLVQSRQYKSRRHARFRFRHARTVGKPAAHAAREMQVPASTRVLQKASRACIFAHLF